jgi:apolipoprotein D and lipocalin family protein
LPDIANGYATIPNLSEPNRLKVKFPGSPFPGNYDVWKTDYKTYTLIYSCTQIVPGSLKYELIWILSREKTLDQSVVTDLKRTLTEKNVSVSDFEQTPQSNCN